MANSDVKQPLTSPDDENAHACGNIVDDRAEGTSHGSGNPSAVSYSVDASYARILESLHDEGFDDAHTAEAAFLFERVSEWHMRPYLEVAAKALGSKNVKLAHDLMYFDRRCQSVLFEYIGVFETQLRAQFGHWLREEAGDYAIHEQRLFLNQKNYQESIRRLNTEAARKAKNSRTFAKCMNNGQIRIDAAVECMSLGTLSQLYSNCKQTENTKKIAESFGVSKSDLVNWSRTITAARNACAHFDCLFLRKQLQKTPRAIRGINGMSSRKPFYLVLLIEKLLSSSMVFGDQALHYSSRLAIRMTDEIEQVEENVPGLMDYLGLPDDWRSILASPDLVDALIVSAWVDEERETLSLGLIGDEAYLPGGFKRAGVRVIPKDVIQE